MTTEIEHVEGVANLIADYRQGEIAPPDAEHVSRWLHQFDAQIRAPFIAEVHHVLSQTYLSRSTFEEFYRNQIEHDKLTGGDHTTFWRQANFLRAQSHGTSQTDILKIFGKALHDTLGLRMSRSGGGSHFVYIDDILFSGNRVASDLEQWIANQAPNSARVIVLLMATHEFGEYSIKRRLNKAAQDANKQITFEFWSSARLENRKAYRNNSDVLWPIGLPAEAAGYDQGKFPLEPRSPGGKSGLFSSEAARQVLENGFLSAGLRIRSFSQNPRPILRPLGFSPFGVGFGSTFVTYRNCPNNAPLALWWGDPEAAASHPFSKWRPLVPRKTYGPFDNVEL